MAGLGQRRPIRLDRAYPSKRERRPEWQAAAAPLLIAERGGPTMFARIGMMRALNTGKPDPQIRPPRKQAKKYRVVR